MKIAIWLKNPVVSEWTCSERQANLLRDLAPGYDVQLCATRDEFAESLKTAVAAITWECEQSWLDSAKNLRLLATPAAGHDYLQVNPPAGVMLSFGTFHGRIIAETVAGYLLGVARGLFQNLDAMRSQREAWPRGKFTRKTAMLCGSTVVIAGFGHIGQHIARLLKPFGVKIIGLKRNPGIARPAFFDTADEILGMDRFDDAIAQADHLVFALPGDASTDNLLTRERIAKMKPAATFSNIGRGNSVDEDALADALQSGKLAFAMLDVFREEPLPQSSRLRSIPNCYIFPHSSAIAPGYLDYALRDFAAQLHRI